MATITDAQIDAVTYQCNDEQISEAVVSAVAEASGVDPLEMEPLYNVVDADALNAVFRDTKADSSAGVEVRFSMAGCRVIVRGHDDVVAIPEDASDARPSAGSHEA